MRASHIPLIRLRPTGLIAAPTFPRDKARQVLRLGLALLLIANLASPLFARPPSKCRLGSQSNYASMSDATVTEQILKDLRLRVLVDVLDDVDIVFSGRLAKRRYLSDVRETDVPTILEVYEGVSVLKGRMPSAEKDGKAILIREKVCDGGCWLNALPEEFDARSEPERVVLAATNTLENKTEARDRLSNRVVYTGRIDALGGACDPRQINAAAAAELMASPHEMDRLRRAYPPRSAEDKRRDEDLIIKRVIGVPLEVR